MKIELRFAACALAVVLLAAAAPSWSGPTPAKPQGMPAAKASGDSSVLKDLTADWGRQKATMMAISDAMPEDKFGYKSTPPQRNYGEQIMHIALVNVQLLKVVGGKAPAPTFTAQSVKTKADMLKALSDSYDYGLALLKEQNDASIVQTIPAPAFLGPSTRARIFWTLLGHTNDIYGQMAVYLRLNGIVPPASRNPMP